jgi:nitrogen regulatory protein P-II 2
MQLRTLKKVTIVTEDAIKIPLCKKMCELGATGYTTREVSGYGSRGVRSDPFASNVQIDVICPEAVATAILTYVSHHYFDHHACVAWMSDVQVVRGDRFNAPPPHA